MIETAADLAAFFNPNEFADLAIIDGVAQPVGGIMTTAADQQRAGATSGSSMGSWLVGAADLSIQTLQFITPWAPVSAVQVEATMTIPQGRYAGTYRVKDIQRDGEIVRLVLSVK